MRRLAIGFAALAMYALTQHAGAQQPPPGLPTPRTNDAFPAGLKAGTSVEITLTGTDLDEPTGLLFSHPGLKAEYLPPEPPKPDPKKKDKQPKMAAPSTKGPHKFKVTADASVPPGTYDLRFVGQWGVSNPRAVVVGELPEVNEKEPNNDVPEAQKVEIGTTINGVFSGGTDVDYTVFTGKAGQRVILSCLASSIDSRAHPMIEVITPDGHKLASNRNYRDTDAVVDLTLPADGEYLIRLFVFTYQQGGQDHFYRLTISSAPWIDAVFPTAVEPGKPTQVTLYGRNLPGSTRAEGFTVGDRPLEKLTVTVTPPTDAQATQRLAVRDYVAPVVALQDGFEYRLKGPGGNSNAVTLFFAREKLILKKNAGDTKPETAEAIPVPCEVAGMIQRRNDRDWYRFEAKKGDQLLVELLAERNGTPADFYFHVYNPGDPAKMAKLQDLSGEIDDETNQQDATLHPTEFYTRTGDPPAYKFTAPADGKFLIAVGCRESSFQTGPRTAYRLRVAPAKPDFRAVVKHHSKSFQTGSAGRQNGTEVYEVFVQRMDGFSGAVKVTVDGLPGGVTAKPCVIGSGAKWGTLVLDVADSAATFNGFITVKATADIAGKSITREVRPTAVTWGVQQGQNVPVLARLTDRLPLAVRPEKAMFKLAADTSRAVIKPAKGKDEKVSGPIVVKQGEKVTLPVKVTWINPEKQNITLAGEPISPSQQNTPIAVQPGKQPTKDKPEGEVTLDIKSNALPGVYTLVIRGDAQVPFIRDPKDKKKGNVPVSGFTDPIEVTVIPTSLAKVKAGQIKNGSIKLGATGELAVNIERQYAFDGEYKVKYVPPMGVSGVTADEVTVPAGKEEAKLVIKVASGAKPGSVNNGTVVVTAVYNKHTITHEVKVSFNVAK